MSPKISASLSIGVPALSFAAKDEGSDMLSVRLIVFAQTDSFVLSLVLFQVPLLLYTTHSLTLALSLSLSLFLILPLLSDALSLSQVRAVSHSVTYLGAGPNVLFLLSTLSVPFSGF